MKEKMKPAKLILPGILICVTLIIACSNPKKKPVVQQVESNSWYTCPMHPQILEEHPGNCPICGMTLVKKSGQASEETGINLSTVLQPVSSAVISSVKSITPVQKKVSALISASGYLDFDVRTFNNISARFSGRVEKLYLKYAFQQIHIGQRIFDIYSPELVTAQQDLIYLSANSPEEETLIHSARQKLLLLGMTSTQISQVVKTAKPFYSLPVYSPYEGHVHDMPHTQMAGAVNTRPSSDFSGNLPLSIKEGNYVEKGQPLFNVVNPHQLWAVIKIDRSAIAGLTLNQPVKITLPDLPGRILQGKVNFIAPSFEDGDKSTTIRVYLNNMDHELKVNSLVKATIQTGEISGLWIPRSALLDLGHTQVIWIKKGTSFVVRQVFTGAISGREIQVTRGLSLTDSLAADAQYLSDSENFIKVKGDEY